MDIKELPTELEHIVVDNDFSKTSCHYKGVETRVWQDNNISIICLENGIKIKVSLIYNHEEITYNETDRFRLVPYDISTEKFKELIIELEKFISEYDEQLDELVHSYENDFDDVVNYYTL